MTEIHNCHCEAELVEAEAIQRLCVRGTFLVTFCIDFDHYFFMSDVKNQFDKVIEHLQAEISTIRTGRATPALLDNIVVEAYDTMQSLKALASLSAPDTKTLLIEPWDTSVLRNIESAIQKSDLGINPIIDGKTVRLSMPPMTEENRKKLVKILYEKCEDARVSVRRVREDARKEIGKQTGVSEDVIRKEQENLDKMTKDYIAKIDDIADKKEEEIMKV